MATSYVEKSEKPPDMIPTTPPSEAVCLLEWKEKDGVPYIGTGFLAQDQDSKQVYWMTAGHNLENLDLCNPEMPEEQKIRCEDYFIRFAHTKHINRLYKMNLSDFFQICNFQKDKILFKRPLNDDKVNADFMIVPLGDTLESLREKFDKIDAIPIAKDKTFKESAKDDFYVLGHPTTNNKEVIQKFSRGTLSEPEELKANCRKEERRIEIEKMKSSKLFHTVDTDKGSSGSPLMFYRHNQWNVVGIHVGGLDKISFQPRRHANYAESILPLVRKEQEGGKPILSQTQLNQT